MRYMVPLEQRRKLAEMYGSEHIVPPTPEMLAEEAAEQAAAASPKPAGRCYSCRYVLASIGHQVTCGGDPS